MGKGELIMAITGYDYNYTGDGKQTTVNIPGRTANNTGTGAFTGSQSFFGSTAAKSDLTAGTLVISGGLGVQNGVMANSVWGAVWNDLADCIIVPDDTELEPGYAYCFNGQKYYKSTKYMDDGFIGIHSDTAGFSMGKQSGKKQLQVGVAGFILVYVDKEYPVGTPLTLGDNGKLTKLKDEDILMNPHKIIATFWKKEPNRKWGPVGEEVEVNGRMWVKVR